MTEVQKLAHVMLNVSNAQASKEFYCKVLGLTVSAESADGKTVHLSLGEHHHDLALVEGATGPRTDREAAEPHSFRLAGRRLRGAEGGLLRPEGQGADHQAHVPAQHHRQHLYRGSRRDAGRALLQPLGKRTRGDADHGSAHRRPRHRYPRRHPAPAAALSASRAIPPPPWRPSCRRGRSPARSIRTRSPRPETR